MANPIPVIANSMGEAASAPAGAVPIALYGGPVGSSNLDDVLQALGDAGFGTSGQVLATNSTGDGFEWVTPS